MCCLGTPDICCLGTPDMCCLGTPDICCLWTPDTLGSHGGTLGVPGGPWGALGGGVGGTFHGKVVFRLGERPLWNTSPDSPDSPDAPDPANRVSSTATRTPTSTRAGGQDDVSLNKLPQTNLAG